CRSRRKETLTFSRTRLSLVTSSATRTGATNLLQFLVLRRRTNNQRREKLLQHITILREQKAEELLHVMTDYVHLQSLDDTSILNRFIFLIQPNHLFERQNMHPAQIKI